MKITRKEAIRRTLLGGLLTAFGVGAVKKIAVAVPLASKPKSLGWARKTLKKPVDEGYGPVWVEEDEPLPQSTFPDAPNFRRPEFIYVSMTFACGHRIIVPAIKGTPEVHINKQRRLLSAEVCSRCAARGGDLIGSIGSIIE